MPIALQRKVATISRDWRSRTLAAAAWSGFQQPIAASAGWTKASAPATRPSAVLAYRCPVISHYRTGSLRSGDPEREASHGDIGMALPDAVNPIIRRFRSPRSAGAGLLRRFGRRRPSGN